MKPLLLFSLSLIFFTSCKKDFTAGNTNSVFLSNVKEYLKDSLSADDFANLNFSGAIITNPDSATNFLRIPFKGVIISEQFVLLKTHAAGKILRGFIINLHKDASESKTKLVYNGSIEIESLNRRGKIQSRIVNGYVSAFHLNGTNHRSLVVPSEAYVLPEVVVTCYIDGGGRGINYTDWISLLSLFGTGNSGYYSSLDGGGGGGGGSYSGSYNSYSGAGDYNEGSQYGGGSNSGGNYDQPRADNNQMTIDDPILVDFELVESQPPIDIARYLKCFSNIPDDGSTCSIEIFCDIPVDDHPNIFFDWKTNSPGHTFLQLTKTRGNETVLQNIGFYPDQEWKMLLTGPVSPRFVDNKYHEYNAGLKMNLTSEQLKNTLSYISRLASYVKYDIDDYNCTDFALDVFNYSRASNPLVIPKYTLPGSTAPNGSNTPQGLYNKINEMQRSNIDKANITIPVVKHWAPRSNGPCN